MQLSTYEILGLPEDIEPVQEILKKYDPRLRQDSDLPDFHVIVGGDSTINYHKDNLYGSKVFLVHNREKSPKSLGFTADVNMETLEKGLEDIIRGNYTMRRSYAIDCLVGGYKVGTALNEVNIKAKDPRSSIFFKGVVDCTGYDRKPENEPLSSPKACDGFMVVTPRGSTAWSYSYQGPVVVDTDVLITNLYGSDIAHSIVWDSRAKILIIPQYDSLAIIDSILKCLVEKHRSILVQKSDKYIEFIRPLSTYESVISKMKRKAEHSWSGIEV